MPGSVIVGSARTPIGKLSGALAGFSADGPRRARDQGRARARRRRRRAGRLRAHGPGAAGRAGPDHRPPGRGEGRHPDDGAGDDHQQGVPLGHQRDLPRRPDDPGGRRRGRRRRRHGVDDERAVPPAGRARRLPHGQQRGRRLADQRRPVVRVRRGAHGRGTEKYVGQVGGITRERRTSSRRRATSAPPPRRRKAASPTRSRRSRSRSARATRSSSTPTRACAPARPPSRSAACAPRSRRTARSPPATRRRSPTARAAVIMMSKAKAEELGATPLAELVGYGMVAGPDPSLLTQPSRAIKRALEADRHDASPTSTCSSSTRRSPRSASRRCATSASPTTS